MFKLLKYSRENVASSLMVFQISTINRPCATAIKVTFNTAQYLTISNCTSYSLGYFQESNYFKNAGCGIKFWIYLESNT